MAPMPLKSHAFWALLTKHHFVTSLNLAVHIHDPLHYGPGVILGIITVHTKLPTAVFGIPMQNPNSIVQMTGLHILNGNGTVFGRPCG